MKLYLLLLLFCVFSFIFTVEARHRHKYSSNSNKCPVGEYYHDGCTECRCDPASGSMHCRRVACFGTSARNCPHGPSFEDRNGNRCACYEATGAIYCQIKMYHHKNKYHDYHADDEEYLSPPRLRGHPPLPPRPPMPHSQSLLSSSSITREQKYNNARLQKNYFNNHELKPHGPLTMYPPLVRTLTLAEQVLLYELLHKVYFVDKPEKLEKEESTGLEEYSGRPTLPDFPKLRSSSKFRFDKEDEEFDDEDERPMGNRYKVPYNAGRRPERERERHPEERRKKDSIMDHEYLQDLFRSGFFNNLKYPL